MASSIGVHTIFSMNAHVCKCGLAILVLIITGGCEVGVEPIILETADIEPRVDYGDLGFVLEKVVTPEGLLIGEALEEHSKRLEAQLKLLAKTGPRATRELFASLDKKLAYWYNARAAWAMKLAIVSKRPKDTGPRELIDRPFPLDGRTMTLRDIDEILAARADWRVLVSAPGVTLQRARLPEAPFTPKDVRSRIADRISEFVDDERRVVIDVPGRRILFPPILWRYREALIEDYHRTYGTEGANLTTALLRYVSGSAHRRLQDSIGYRPVPSRRPLLVALFEK